MFKRKSKTESGSASPWLTRMKAQLARTSGRLTGGLDRLLGRGLDDEAFDELEMRLLSADVGIGASRKIIQALRREASCAGAADNMEQLLELLQAAMVSILAPREHPLAPGDNKPFVILLVGVNGSGKTTTAGRLAHYYSVQGKSVMLAAGDTFRAAAIEQLQVWGQRLNAPVIAQAPGADSAAVIFDALTSARSRGADLLLADTAGRLHTDGNLMQELQKVKRVMAKQDASAPHETLLVVDGGTGQNALAQVREFHQALGLTGIAVTKLDGTARGGVLLAIAGEFEIPIRFIGIGEAAEDLRVFNAGEYARAVLGGAETGADPAR